MFHVLYGLDSCTYIYNYIYIYLNISTCIVTISQLPLTKFSSFTCSWTYQDYVMNMNIMSVSVSQKKWGLPQICLEIAEMRQEQLVIFVGAAWNFGHPESGDTPKRRYNTLWPPHPRLSVLLTLANHQHPDKWRFLGGLPSKMEFLVGDISFIQASLRFSCFRKLHGILPEYTSEYVR